MVKPIIELSALRIIIQNLKLQSEVNVMEIRVFVKISKFLSQKTASWSSGNAFVYEMGGLRLKYRPGQIRHSIFYGSLVATDATFP